MGPEFHPARIALSFSLVGPVVAYFIDLSRSKF